MLICPDCPTCVDSVTNAAVLVPKCYQEPALCPLLKCPRGQELLLGRRKGIEGAAPCCQEFSCITPTIPGISASRHPDAMPPLPGLQLNASAAAAAALLGSAEFSACAEKRCTTPPWKCPKDSVLGIPNTNGTCPMCACCVDAQARRVVVPDCLMFPNACPDPGCIAPESHRVLAVAAGDNGKAPCCPVYVCAPGPPPADDNDVEEVRVDARTNCTVKTTSLGDEWICPDDAKKVATKKKMMKKNATVANATATNATAEGEAALVDDGAALADDGEGEDVNKFFNGSDLGRAGAEGGEAQKKRSGGAVKAVGAGGAKKEAVEAKPKGRPVYTLPVDNTVNASKVERWADWEDIAPAWTKGSGHWAHIDPSLLPSKALRGSASGSESSGGVAVAGSESRAAAGSESGGSANPAAPAATK